MWNKPPYLPVGGFHHLWCGSSHRSAPAGLPRTQYHHACLCKACSFFPTRGSLSPNPSLQLYWRGLSFGGGAQRRSWLIPVFTLTDLELVQTAGLDSLMLNWTNTLGIQIFLPLTILGMAVCERPVLLCWRKCLQQRRPQHGLHACCRTVVGKRMSLRA